MKKIAIIEALSRKAIVTAITLLILAGGLGVLVLTSNNILASISFGNEKKTVSSNVIEKLETKAGSEDGAYELSKIKAASSEVEASEWYLKLIEKVGPALAQDKLNAIGDWTGPMHLVDHTVGNYLFDKYGSSGIAYCKEYFGGACYHGVLLNFLGAEHQDAEISKALLHCQEKGDDTPMACSHAIGHGVLAKVGYKNLPQAIQECNRISAFESLLRLIDCHDGVFMENIFGVHDGKPSPDRWVKQNDLNYPCSDVRFREYQEACWRNQFARVREVVGPYNYPAIQKYCDPLLEKLKETCFTGIYRTISAQTKNNLTWAAVECAKVTTQYGGEKCVMNVASYSFYQGDREKMLGYCNTVKGPIVKDCFRNLVWMMKNRISPNEQRAYCNRIIISEWRNYCLDNREY